jgi:hypothetical protein
MPHFSMRVSDRGSAFVADDVYGAGNKGWSWLGRSSQPRADINLWDTYRIDLVTELDRLSSEDREKEIIAKLLDPQQSRKAWESLYEAEQRLAFKRDDDAVKADWARRIVEAESLGVKSAASLRAQFDDAAATAASRKATYLRLLDDLHFRYSKRRLDRQKRRETAIWLNYVGVALVAVGLLITIAGWIWQQPLGKFIAQAHLFYAIWFGVLGAYFSRSVSMRSSIATLDYDLLVSDYSKWSVGQRLIIGGIAALVMYFLIAGRLLAGDLFPMPEYSNALLDGKSGDTTLAIPSAGFAKLLIWSVIAGFSERLLPDQLNRLESSTRDSGQDKPRSQN